MRHSTETIIEINSGWIKPDVIMPEYGDIHRDPYDAITGDGGTIL